MDIQLRNQIKNLASLRRRRSLRLAGGFFYEANPDGPNMTKQKLLDYAKEIDDEFGHLFLPPVR